MRTLLIDNYDSYTYNLYHLLGELRDEAPIVVRNDEARWDELAGEAFDSIVLSPGPGRPDRERDVGISRDALLNADVPVLGICLGHQLLATAFGGVVARAPQPAHGIRTRVEHDGCELFQGLPQRFLAVRYHSLAVRAVPNSLRVTAWTTDGDVMGLAHRVRPLWGVQFHPESVWAEHGRELLANFRDLIPRRAIARPARGRRPRGRPANAPCADDQRPTETPSGSQVRLHVRSLAPIECDPAVVFSALYGRHQYAIWLDSARVEDGLSRFSFIGTPDGPMGQVVRYDVRERSLVVERSGSREQLREDVLTYCERELSRLAADLPALPFGFTCGFAGYFGYELKADCGAARGWPSPLPDAGLIFCDRVIAFDHATGAVHLVAISDRDGRIETERWLDTTEQQLRALAELAALPVRTEAAAGSPIVFTPRDSDSRYRAKIGLCQSHILDGESYEICLTTEFTASARIDPLGCYRRLRACNPAPAAAFLRLGDLSVLSSSPERFMRIGRDRVVESKPIKGTAARSVDPAEDQRLAEQLGRDDKSLAENLMIADLVRNDLGRVAELGSVTTPHLMHVESYATVHQLVTTVQARLDQNRSPIDCVRAAFPGGSMTGAPKLRTLEIIDRLETRPRGIYSGALGYLSVNGCVDLSIVIRTIVVDDDRVSIGAGGAILACSDPEAELREMHLKAEPLLRAMNGVLNTDAERGSVAA